MSLLEAPCILSPLTADRFAPNSTDFDEGAASEDSVLAWEEYHVVNGIVAYSPLMTDGKQFQTLQGSNLTITVLPNGSKYVNDVKVLDSDYLTSNGVFHVLEKSLNPNNTSARPQINQTLPTTTANSTTSQTGAPGMPISRRPAGLSGGVKAGIGVGAAVGGLAIVSLGLWYLWRRKHVAAIPRDPPVDPARYWKSELEQPQPKTVQKTEAAYAELDGCDRHELQ